MLRRCCFQNAVPEIEDERSLARCTKDAFDFNRHPISASDKHLWIKVALDTALYAMLDHLSRPAKGHSAVEPDAVSPGCLGIAVVKETCCPGKSDNGNFRVRQTKRLDDAGDGLNAALVHLAAGGRDSPKPPIAMR